MLKRALPTILGIGVCLSALAGGIPLAAFAKAYGPPSSSGRQAVGFERPAENAKIAPPSPAANPRPIPLPDADTNADTANPATPNPLPPQAKPEDDPAEQARIKRQLEAIAKQNEREAKQQALGQRFFPFGPGFGPAQAHAQAMARAFQFGGFGFDQNGMPRPFVPGFDVNANANANLPVDDDDADADAAPEDAPQTKSSKRKARAAAKARANARAKANVLRRLGANAQPFPVPPNRRGFGFNGPGPMQGAFQAVLTINGRTRVFNDPIAYQRALREAGMNLGGPPPGPGPLPFRP